jgi:hypothetical protein
MKKQIGSFVSKQEKGEFLATRQARMRRIRVSRRGVAGSARVFLRARNFNSW